ncbi:SdpI family protein [Bacillus velezensis]|uniref:SdpI family protein n=1 Tax=Bacillus velezensis TaxID=492670 RepID=UPI0021767764|nr:SdpI family protein [Bacillus velezensis]
MIMAIGGLLMAAAGISVTFFSPKSINSLYGYRTKRSMADESQWKEGNRFSALLMILFGLISAAAGFAGSLLIRLTQPFALIVQAVLLIAISVLIIVLTERRLKQTGRRIDE